ncbi:MAG: hypothetical protein RBU29_05460, partial [bacterium]|nr:hypothetical protein [bacterium]
TNGLPKKSPVLAGLLSFTFPCLGLGQFYNGEITKGFLILLSLFGSIFLLFVGHLFPWNQIGIYSMSSPFGLGAYTPRIFFREIYPFLFVLFVFTIWLFSIIDAVVSARRFRSMYAYGGPYPFSGNPQGPAGFSPVYGPAPVPPHPSPSTGFMKKQSEPYRSTEERQEAQQTMGTQDTFYTPPPGGYPQDSQSPPPLPSQEKGASGKLVFAVALLIVGGIMTLNQMNVSWISFDKLWPLIPLLFGIRLLRDYYMDRESGQFILGIVFASIGGLFALEAWTSIQLLDWIIDHRGLVLLTFGGLLFWQDYRERHTHSDRR